MQKVTSIWATRPIAQNGEWVKCLSSLANEVVEIPLLGVAPVTDPESVQAAKNLIMDFDQFQKVIFVSQNAVHYAFQWLEDYWPQLPTDIEYFAVGEKTAASIKQHHLDAACGSVSMNSEELLALPELQDVWGQRILICRGCGGLPKMGEVLHERGAVVRYCELYHRQVPPHAAERLQQQVAKLSAANRAVVPVFSGETLNNLNNLLVPYDRAIKDHLELVVPGNRVADLAHSMGFQSVHTARNASQQEMLEAIIASQDGSF